MKTKLLFTYLFFFLSISYGSYAQDGHGQTITGIRGITKTVGEIEAFSAAQEARIGRPIYPVKEERELPEPKHSKDEKNHLFSKWPVSNEGSNSTASTAGVTQTIHSNFMATDFTSALGGWPPDNNGDVGTTQVFIAQNFRFKVYAKPSITAAAVTTPNGTSTTLLTGAVLDVDQNSFFQTAFPGTNTTDPHVRFDRLSQRWYIISQSTNEATNNYMLFAISSGATIASTASFTFYRVNISTIAGDAGNFYDYPTFGVDATSLYIGLNLFTSGGAYVHSSGYVVNKASLIAGTMTLTAFAPMANISTPQGVNNDDPTATEGYFIGSSGFTTQLAMRRITYPGGVPTISAGMTVTVNAFSAPLGQVASGTTGGTLDASNSRLFAAMVTKNKITGVSTLWTSHCSKVTVAGVGSAAGDRNAGRWYEIQNLTTTPTLRQSGTLFNDAAANPRGFWFPSIAMSGQGHAILAASTAGANAFCDIAIAGRYRTTVLGDLEDSVHATATGSAYNPFNGGTFVNRWGDYSQIGVDPLDNMTMWAFHQYANTTTANGSYGIRAIQMKAPAPPVSVSLSAVPGNFCSNATAVTMTGVSVNNTEFFDPGADVSGPGFTRLTVTCSGGVAVSNVVFVSPTQVTCNVNTIGKASGTYTLTITNPDGQTTTAAFTLASTCVLPVNLLDFTGRLEKNETVLNWRTADEYNMKGYDVEKSFDGSNFKLLQFVAPKGTANAEANYLLNDKKPFPGNNYYRLKLINADGTFRYSNIVLVQAPGKSVSVASMYPNPAKDKFTIEVFADKVQKINITLYDFSGRRVMVQKRTAETGLHDQQLNLSTLAAGTYYVEVKSAAGTVIEKTKLVKE